MTSGMSIGEVAKRSGLPSSTLRYYERRGLLPAARRESGRRRYDEDVFEKLAIIAFARDTGFTLTEIHQLFSTSSRYSSRLRSLAAAKIQETNTMIERALAMRALLRTVLRCRCIDVSACGRRLLALTGTTR